MTSATEARSSARSLAELLDARASRQEIASFLDDLAPATRVEAVLGVKGSRVGKLYDAVAGAEPVSIDEFVPPDGPATLIYEGRNSLPLFSRFQKRFARVEGGLVVGYNHQTMSPITGPGYFVLKEPSGEGELGDELLFDYTEEPRFQPPGWPALAPNDRGLSRLVYANMHDYCRRVAKGVIVGKAYKKGVDQKAYFSLSRPL